MAYAFRCKNCGRLEEAPHAGEEQVPYACRVCGRGVSLGFDPADFHRTLVAMIPTDRQLSAEEVHKLSKEVHQKIVALPTGKKVQPENWEVLHECDDKRLKELGLARLDVAKHVPVPKAGPPNKPKNLFVAGMETLGAADKTDAVKK